MKLSLRKVAKAWKSVSFREITVIFSESNVGTDTEIGPGWFVNPKVKLGQHKEHLIIPSVSGVELGKSLWENQSAEEYSDAGRCQEQPVTEYMPAGTRPIVDEQEFVLCENLRENCYRSRPIPCRWNALEDRTLVGVFPWDGFMAVAPVSLPCLDGRRGAFIASQRGSDWRS